MKKYLFVLLIISQATISAAPLKVLPQLIAKGTEQTEYYDIIQLPNVQPESIRDSIRNHERKQLQSNRRLPISVIHNLLTSESNDLIEYTEKTNTITINKIKYNYNKGLSVAVLLRKSLTDNIIYIETTVWSNNHIIHSYQDWNHACQLMGEKTMDRLRLVIEEFEEHNNSK